MHEVLLALHHRHKHIGERYGKPVAKAVHAGEGVYLGSSVLGLEHSVMVYVYGVLFVLWVCHTVAYAE